MPKPKLQPKMPSWLFKKIVLERKKEKAEFDRIHALFYPEKIKPTYTQTKLDL